MRCFYFGCWNEPGHYLWGPGGNDRLSYVQRQAIEYSGGVHIDGSLAPRRKRTGEIFWEGQPEPRRIDRGGELPQGQFLRHVLDNGFTAIAWWDSHQGDTRPGCNSTILLEGEHTTAEMLAALETHFPHVKANLDRAGVVLVEVFPGLKEAEPCRR